MLVWVLFETLAVQFPSYQSFHEAPGKLEAEALFFLLSFVGAAEPSCEAQQVHESSETSALLQTNGPKDAAANLLQTMAPKDVRNVLQEAAGYQKKMGL